MFIKETINIEKIETKKSLGERKRAKTRRNLILTELWKVSDVDDGYASRKRMNNMNEEKGRRKNIANERNKVPNNTFVE